MWQLFLKLSQIKSKGNSLIKLKREKFTKDFLVKKIYGNYLQNDPRSKVKGIRL